MTIENTVNYGPLTDFIGTWVGNKGTDLSPEPDATETNLYTETMVFTEALELDNAEEQSLSAVHYTLKVIRIDGGKVIHQETGYWLWEQETNKVIHSLTIPRGMSVLAGGTYENKADNSIEFNVEATIGESDWQIIQSPFMHKKAKMTQFDQQFVLNKNTLSYSQTMMLDIYGREFAHTDENVLTKQA